MASPFLYGHKNMVAHAIHREKLRIQEFKRKEREKRRNELYEINGSKNNHVMEDDNNTTDNNDNRKRKSLKINLKPKNPSGYCENCHVSYRDLNKHVQTKKHIMFENNDDNFKELLKFTSTLYDGKNTTTSTITTKNNNDKKVNALIKKRGSF